MRPPDVLAVSLLVGLAATGRLCGREQICKREEFTAELVGDLLAYWRAFAPRLAADCARGPAVGLEGSGGGAQTAGLVTQEAVRRIFQRLPLVLGQHVPFHVLVECVAGALAAEEGGGAGRRLQEDIEQIVCG